MPAQPQLPAQPSFLMPPGNRAIHNDDNDNNNNNDNDNTVANMSSCSSNSKTRRQLLKLVCILSNN